MIQETDMQTALDSRIRNLLEKMQEEELDAYIVTSRQNSRYIAGFTGTTSVILITSERREVFVDSRYTEQAHEQCQGYEVSEVNSLMGEAVESLKRQNVRRIGLEEKDVTWAVLRNLDNLIGDTEVELVPSGQLFTALREIKDSIEIANIREAVRIADLAWEQTLPEIRAGVSEAYVAAVLEHNMRLLGAEGPSFETIIASGFRSAMPHGVASDKIIEQGDTIVMDFGALYHGYCSDITRTVFVGEADPRIREIYDIVLEAQLACERSLKPGMKGSEGDALARDIIADRGFGPQFGHSTGHSLGLDIHESPNLSRLYDRALPAGCLLTVEPGIYLPGIGGVRIEDTVLLIEGGIEILTKADKTLRIL